MTTSNIKSAIVVGEPAEPALVLPLFRARSGRLSIQDGLYKVLIPQYLMLPARSLDPEVIPEREEQQKKHDR